MSTSPAERFFAVMQGELNKERAAVLGRYGGRVEVALARCDALAAALDAGSGDDDAAVLDDYRTARAAALVAIDAFCLQREVIGLVDHTWVDRIYPRPPAR